MKPNKPNKGVCNKSVTVKLPCGHETSRECGNQEPEGVQIACNAICGKRNLACIHQCEKPCHYPSECGPCPKIVPKQSFGCKYHVVAAECGAEVKNVPCTVKTISDTPSRCGHDVIVECYRSTTITPDELLELCVNPCKAMLGKGEGKGCGHRCRGNCNACHQGRFHIRCKEPCEKILICGHRCVTPCGMACQPCPLECAVECEHDKCPYECGVPCIWMCEETCSYGCEHSKCTRSCSEVCNKKLCKEPCKKLLDCGHPCISLCGEVCPPHCRICTPEKLLPGLILGGNEEDARYLFLENCGHSIEIKSMDYWMNTEAAEDEILPKRCPLCLVRLRWMRRYSAIMHQNRKLIDSVRAKLYGDCREVKWTLDFAGMRLNEHPCLFAKPTEPEMFCPELLNYIRDELSRPPFSVPMGKGRFLSMSLEKAKCISWISQMWLTVAETVHSLYGVIPTEQYLIMAMYWNQFIQMAAPSNRAWPLHPNEIQNLQMEMVRFEDSVTLYSQLKNTQPEAVRRLVNSSEGTKAFNHASEALWKLEPYTRKEREEFKGRLKVLSKVLKTTLNITESERTEIVKAFGQRSGRWFKCPNGHIYVITECGGALELGRCNLCGARIGGRDHRLVEKNYLATEMDGAEAPLVPTMVNRDGN